MTDRIIIHDGTAARRCILRRANFGRAFQYLFSAYSENDADNQKYDVYYNKIERLFYCCVMQRKDKSNATL